jgi:hypothetical protein
MRWRGAAMGAVVLAACGGGDGGSASTDAVTALAASCHATIPDGGQADPCAAFGNCHLLSVDAGAWSGCKTWGWNSLVSADHSCACCCD